ncbi:hydroxylysine kinase isoform X1 [Astyanax mexicanus]|uniref:Hydroxylysine kinase n=2 Tax=Astyanax mexicanus TaxID=7994 RepID=A0A8T2L6P0_ASTMX|nr:hydroxylysine kinase isoform X1 [Astyanax mexicanus]
MKYLHSQLTAFLVMSVRDSKPYLSLSQATELTGRLFGLTVTSIRPLPSYDDQNFHVESAESGQYVLKVMNSAASQNLHLLEVQTHIMNFLWEKGLPAQTAVPTVTGQLLSLEEIDCGFGLQKYMVRLLTFLPGTPMAKVTYTSQFLFEVGKTAATVDKLLLQMEHPHLSALQRENFIWNLASVPLLEQFLPLFDGEPIQEVVKRVFEQYRINIAPKIHCFRKCINHGDFNDHNVLVESDASSGYRISGILDFGDMSNGYFVFELAITIMYLMIESSSPLEVGGPVIAGFESVIPLNSEEREAVYLLVLSRFCQSLALGRHAVQQQPENEEYLMITARPGLRLLQLLWNTGKDKVEKIWLSGAAEFLKKSNNAVTQN